MADPGDPAVVPAADARALSSAELALQAGGIVGIPTETVYGLAVLPQPVPLQAVMTAKRRPQDKGIALLVDGLDQVDGLVSVHPVAQRLASAFWPGALTLVLPLRQRDWAPDLLTGGRGTLALRVPDHRIPRTLARRLGPIAVTSANQSGEPEALTAADLLATVGHSLALVIDDGPVRGGIASSVVAVTADGQLESLRDGALASTDILAVVKGDG